MIVVIYTQKILKYRYWVMLSVIMVVSLLGLGIQRLTISTDYEVFFSDENPQLQAFQDLQANYTKDDNVFFVLAPKDGQVFTPKMLAMVQDLTKAAWQTPYSLRVDSISNYQHTYAEEDDLIVENLVDDPKALTAKQLAKIKQIALTESTLVKRLVSETGHVTGVNVTIELPHKDIAKETPEVANFSQALAEEFRQKYPEVDIYLTGLTMMNHAFTEASLNDIQSLIPIMFVFALTLMAILLRSITAVMVTLFIIVFSVVSAMGMAGWMDIILTPPVMSAPTMILTLVIADCVHLLTNFFLQLQKGLAKPAAITESLRINFQPIFLTSLTTAIGFLSMNFSDSPPFRDLGNVVAFGVMLAFVFSVSFLPAMVMLLPLHKPKVDDIDNKIWTKTFAQWVIANKTWIFWLMLAFAIGLISFIPRNELNDEFVKYFDQSIAFRRATDFASENLNGLYRIEYSLPSGEENGIARPDFLQKVDAFAQWYRQQPEVLHVLSLTDTFKRLNKNLHGDDESWFKLPDDSALAAQYLLLYEMSLPYGLDLNNQITIDKSATRLTVTVKNLSTNEFLALEQRAQQWLQQHAPEMQAEGSGATMMFSHIGARNIRSMLTGTSIALVLISFILVFALRSVKIGVLSLVPNLVPIGMAFGLWGLAVAEVGLALSVVIGMALGIVVDDTVHFLSKYLRARREHQASSEEAVLYAFTTVGMALVITSVVLIAGFLVLTLSAFLLNSQMGLATALAIAFALMADFLLLPTLLMKVDT